jgi:hypothetical protein
MPLPLASEFKVQSRTLKQIKRQGQVALYELYCAQGMLIGYEVVVVRIRKQHEAFGRNFPAMEVYPGNEVWGAYGWSYQARDSVGAQKRFGTLLPKWGANLARHQNEADLDPSEGKALAGLL